MNRLIDKYKVIKSICTVEVPWHVWTTLGGVKTRSKGHRIEIFGEDMLLDDAKDFVSLIQARNAVEWYVNQLGGKVKWE